MGVESYGGRCGGVRCCRSGRRAAAQRAPAHEGGLVREPVEVRRQREVPARNASISPATTFPRNTRLRTVTGKKTTGAHAPTASCRARAHWRDDAMHVRVVRGSASGVEDAQKAQRGTKMLRRARDLRRLRHSPGRGGSHHSLVLQSLPARVREGEDDVRTDRSSSRSRSASH
jgi:hypothetical protein